MRSYLYPYWQGITLCLALAGISLALTTAPWLQHHAIGTLTIAIFLGMLLGNTVYRRISHASNPGVTFSRKWLLQLGIVLYGFRLTFSDIAQVGFTGLLIDACVLTSTFGLAWFAGRKLFKLDASAVILIGAGSAICGAAAVMATEPVVKGRPDQVSVAVSTVLVYGTLGMILYPMLYELNLSWHLLPSGSASFGIFTGSTVHEVAQVVAAAQPLGASATDKAVIAKMVRVMMLAPFLMLLSMQLARAQRAGSEASSVSKITVPWFAFLFIAVAGLHSLAWLPSDWATPATRMDNVLLAMAMAALGLGTQFSAILQAGFRPLLLGGILFGWLLLGGALINTGITRLLA